MLTQNIFSRKSRRTLLQYKTKNGILYSYVDVVINTAHSVVSLMLMSHNLH